MKQIPADRMYWFFSSVLRAVVIVWKQSDVAALSCMLLKNSVSAPPAARCESQAHRRDKHSRGLILHHGRYAARPVVMFTKSEDPTQENRLQIDLISFKNRRRRLWSILATTGSLGWQHLHGNGCKQIGFLEMALIYLSPFEPVCGITTSVSNITLNQTLMLLPALRCSIYAQVRFNTLRQG